MMQGNLIEKSDKRQHLIQVAELLFAQHGYEAVSIRQLAKEAGVNLAMISYYFGSKEGLFAAILENKIPRTREKLEEIMLQTTDPWERIARTIDVYVDSMISNHSFSRVITREMSTRQRPDNVKLIVEHVSKNMHIIRGFIEDGQASGQFRAVDNNLTLASFFGTMSTIINNTGIMCKLSGELDETVIYTEVYKDRVRAHLKSLLGHHLLPS
ncbi:MAG: TetR/AcrR family transcriptional regulator [Saprospiraceae bacterium]|nr:TetR/AcrR family transcriptional regulator [Saprospiraceae bacterium]